MKRYLLALALFFALAPSVAFAQCNGIFANNTVCGNITGGANTPRPTNPSAFLGAAGGSNGQIQYNNGGALGGFTMAGDCTESIPNITCTKINGVAYGTLPATDTVPIVTSSNQTTYTAIPNCPSPQVLNYATSTHTFSCNTNTPSTQVGRYANDLGWNQIAEGPNVFQFTTAQFPGTNGFFATDCRSDGKSLYFSIGNDSSSNTSTIVRMDAHTWAVTATFTLGTEATDIALSPGKIWSTDFVTGNIYRADLTSNTQDLTITTGFTAPARGIAYGAGLIVAANGGGGSVSAYNATTGALVWGPVSVGSNPQHIDYNGTYFAVAVAGAGNAVFISTAGAILATVSGGATPFTAFGDGAKEWIVSTDGTITVYDQKSMSLLSTITLEAGAGGHWIQRIRDEMWIAQNSNNKIGVIYADSTTGSAVYKEKIPVGTNPSGVCFTGYDVVTMDYTDWTIRRHAVSHNIFP
jgi:hypothetical protein